MKTIEIAYDNVQWKSIRQHESVLVSIVKVFQQDIVKGRVSVSSVEKSSLQLNIITVTLLSTSMSYNWVYETIQAINTTAFYTLNHEQAGQVFEQYAEYIKS